MTTTIPLTMIVPGDQINARKTGRMDDIDALAASIHAVGLVQSLTVRRIKDADAFEVIDGNRRLQALYALKEAGNIAEDFGVPCVLRENDDAAAHEASLAANTFRLPLHPVDQFEAFARMRAEGRTVAHIATAFSITEKTVKQRLALGTLSVNALQALRDGEITLEHAKILTMTDDHGIHDKMVAVLLKDRFFSEQALRRMVAGEGVTIHDRYMRYVGEVAYREAGGGVSEDLFGDRTLFTDGPLLQSLVMRKLQAEAEKLEADGWKWVCFADAMPRDWHSWPRLQSSEPKLTKAQKDRLAAIDARLEAITDEMDEAEGGVATTDEEAHARLDALDAEGKALQHEAKQINAPVFFKKDRKRAGVVLNVSHQGDLYVSFGVIRPEDVPEPETATVSGEDGEAIETAVDTFEPQGPEAEPEDTGPRPLSDSMVCDLAAIATSAVMADVAKDPALAECVALASMLATALAGRDGVRMTREVTTLSPNQRELPVDGYHDVMARYDGAVPRLPSDFASLLAALMEMPPKERKALFALVVAVTVDLRSWNGSTTKENMKVAEVIGTDIAKVYRPGAADFFEDARCTKAHALQAIAEVAGEAEAAKHADKKKKDLAAVAERLVAKSDWLPEPLRYAEPEPVADEPAEAGPQEAEPLPEAA